MGTVHIRDARKSYGALEVIHGISVDIPDGAFVALVGPSGCGKSTLLRMIAGLEDITSGTISIGDRIINHVAPKDRDIAMVFQNYALYPHMTVRANMGFALRQRGFKKEEIGRRVANATRILGLEHLLDRKPRELSGGQRQRVAMGRAIVRDPNVFLFDEPLSNLDAKLRVQMRSELKELHQRLATTTVYVTHDQVEAMTLADRIVVMNGGHVVQQGDPLELYDSPQSMFVAAFIGSPPMNFFEGRLRDGRFTLNDGGELALPDMRWPSCESITIGVRPEHLKIGDRGWDATVSVIEPTGSETQVTARVNGHQVRILVSGRTGVGPGDSIKIAVEGRHVHVFDTASGHRL
jgi:multiple sugar transport system ATP-binding protein